MPDHTNGGCRSDLATGMCTPLFMMLGYGYKLFLTAFATALHHSTVREVDVVALSHTLASFKLL